MRETEIQYDGNYPNLCSGHLVVTIGEKEEVLIKINEEIPWGCYRGCL